MGLFHSFLFYDGKKYPKRSVFMNKWSVTNLKLPFIACWLLSDDILSQYSRQHLEATVSWCHLALTGCFSYRESHLNTGQENCSQGKYYLAFLHLGNNYTSKPWLTESECFTGTGIHNYFSRGRWYYLVEYKNIGSNFLQHFVSVQRNYRNMPFWSGNILCLSKLQHLQRYESQDKAVENQTYCLFGTRT